MIRLIFQIAVLSLTLTACSMYQSTPPVTTRTASVTVSTATFSLSAEHVAIIYGYYGQQSRGQGRGRGRGNAGLPPGIARNLARGKPLPPGIAKQYLPGSLLTRIPAAPDGLEYIVMAGKLLLVEAATQVVRQVLLESVFG